LKTPSLKYSNNPKEIDFISLYDLLDLLVDVLNKDKSGQNLDETFHYSTAAERLYTELLNKTTSLPWRAKEINPESTDRDNISIDGVAIVKHMMGWNKRYRVARIKQVKEFAASAQQDIPLFRMRAEDGQYNGASSLRAKEIGFNRCDVATLLEKAKAVYNEPKAESVGTNEIKSTNLLNAPERQDGWFEVIADMTKLFHDKHNKIPNETQAWGQLWTTPPEGYAIKIGKDRGEDCLIMPGEKSLSKSQFQKRWKNYTALKPQIIPNKT